MSEPATRAEELARELYEPKRIRVMTRRRISKRVCSSAVITKKAAGPGTVTRKWLLKHDPRFRKQKLQPGDRVTVCIEER